MGPNADVEPISCCDKFHWEHMHKAVHIFPENKPGSLVHSPSVLIT